MLLESKLGDPEHTEKDTPIEVGHSLVHCEIWIEQQKGVMPERPKVHHGRGYWSANPISGMQFLEFSRYSEDIDVNMW